MNKIKLKYYHNPDKDLQEDLIKRPVMSADSMKNIIDSVFHKVQMEGDAALRELTLKFDKVDITSLLVLPQEIEKAKNLINDNLKNSIERAYHNIHSFHRAQRLQSNKIETSEGVICWQEARAIDSVGLYIPGGTAPLFSTVLMLAIPALIAGCKEVVLCSPPDSEGHIHPAILYTADRCGVKKIFKVGGSQAIAAMVFGSESVPKVDKIFGPGNQYVTAAKMKALEYGLSIDLPAGPSEVLVFADETCVPAYIASDLLSQAEHGIDSQVVLVATKAELIDKVEAELSSQLEFLPRKDIASKALANGYAVCIESAEEAFDFINAYAPEHLIIGSDRALGYIDRIRNAGSVFLGNHTPESAGDYASGTNHTLPTAGYAKAYSGVSLDSFIKKITFQSISEKGLRLLGPSIITMAEEECLQAHANAVKIRTQ